MSAWLVDAGSSKLPDALEVDYLLNQLMVLQNIAAAIQRIKNNHSYEASCRQLWFWYMQCNLSIVVSFN